MIAALESHLQQQNPVASGTTAHDIARARHGHRHVLDKVDDQLNTMPVFCQYLLGANIHWLVETYFRARGLPFYGEKRAIEHLRAAEPEIYEVLARFYDTQDLARKVEFTEDLSQRVLAPIGGLWRRDEVLASRDENSADLKTRGRCVSDYLFGDA
jgi:hypothetical protein